MDSMLKERYIFWGNFILGDLDANGVTFSGVSRCSLHQTCHDCQADVACGWCDDGSGSGIGVCMEGGQRGPVNPVTRATHRDKCHAHNWYFTECPRKYPRLIWFHFSIDVSPFHVGAANSSSNGWSPKFTLWTLKRSIIVTIVILRVENLPQQ